MLSNPLQGFLFLDSLERLCLIVDLMGRRELLFFVLGAALSWGFDARAAEIATAPVIEVTFRYETTDPCAPRSMFLFALQERLSNPRLVPGGESSALRVSVVVSDESTEAVLTILLSDGKVLTRSIEAPSCEEAVEAIAFVTAVALDPEADEPVLLRKIGVGENLEAKPVPEKTEEALSQERSPKDEALQRRAPKGGLFASLGAAFKATWGPVPSTALGAELAGIWGTRGGGWWSPALRLGASYQGANYQAEKFGGANFELLHVSLDLCPSEWRSVGRGSGVLSFRPCLQGVFGATISEGTGHPLVQSAVRPWAQMGMSGRAGIDLGERWTLSLNGALGHPLIRDTYQLEEVDFYEVPRVVASLDLGVEFRYW